MSRPRNENPTPAELDVLKILWDRGPCTVREVHEVLNKERAYTSVMSLLAVMAEKGLLRRKRRGRAFVYEAVSPRKKTLGNMLGDLWQRVYEGSTDTLVAHLLEETHPSEEELRLIRETLDAYSQNSKES